MMKTRTFLRCLGAAVPALLAAGCSNWTMITNDGGEAPLDGSAAKLVAAAPAAPAVEAPAALTQVRLGAGVLVPRGALAGEALPATQIGPFEFKEEGLATALQKALGDQKIPFSFETDEAFKRKVNASHLRGSVGDVTKLLCGAVDLHCIYSGGKLVVRKVETYAVPLPTLPESLNVGDAYAQIAAGLAPLVGGAPQVDASHRSLTYVASPRAAKDADGYFGKLRAGGALVVYGASAWKVALDDENVKGIAWSTLFGASAHPVVTEATISNFVSGKGEVTPVSLPDLTALSGTKAVLNALRDKEGLDISIGATSVWANEKVSGEVDVSAADVPAGNQPPRTASVPVNVRAGDAILVAGLVAEREVPGKTGGWRSYLFMETPPRKQATELVFLLRPRVVTFTDAKEVAPVAAPAQTSVAAPAPMPVAAPAPVKAAAPAPAPAPVPVPVPDVPDDAYIPPAPTGNDAPDAADLPESLSPDEIMPQKMLTK